MKKTKIISDTVISRVLYYLKIVRQLERENKKFTSSEELAKRTDISAFLVRKDLSNFGKFGQPGMGYDVLRLKTYLLDIIGGKEICNIAIAGVGHLGSALLNYNGFEEEGLKFAAAFDRDEGKIGRICGNIIVEHIDNMKESIKKKCIYMGIIAVPVPFAQEVADKFIEAGVFSILNFAPVAISVDFKKVTLRNVDLSIELKALQYFSARKK